MEKPPKPPQERYRLSTLRDLDVLDTPPDEVLEHLVAIAAETFGVPIALVSLVDENRQWFKARFGLDAQETPRNISFCGHAILDDQTLIVADTLADPRFADNPLVCMEPHIRFYAGRPLIMDGGYRIGTLCLIDRIPRDFSTQQGLLLDRMAALVEVELRRTAQLNRQRRIADTQRMLMQCISHELITPVNALQGNLNLLAEQFSDKRGKALLERACEESDRLGTLVHGITEFSLSTTGLLEMDEQPFDFHALLSELAARFALRCELAGLDFTYQCDDDVPDQLVGDAQRVRQSISALLSNSLRYSLRGKITLEVSAQTTMQAGVTPLAIAVTDTGIGIQPDMIEAIFEPFIRSKHARTLAPEGLGLGLSVARQLAQLMSGGVFAQSDGATGSTFSLHLSLPVAHQADSEQSRPTATNCLVVEDSVSNRLVIQAMLAKEEGIEVECVGNGEQALSLAKERDFDVILMDIGLPGMNGVECARKIRALHGKSPKPRIIAISAEQFGRNATEMRKAGFDTSLRKPFTKAKLLATL